MIASHDQLFKGVLSGSALVGRVESIRHLGPHVAVLHATGSVQMAWRSALPKRGQSRQTIVAVNTQGGWKVAALHNGRVRPVGVPSPGSMPSRASQAMTRAARALHIGNPR
jgi:uncharacterized protein (TIGR02246 family)